MELTPKIIYTNLKNKKLDKPSAFKLLVSLIEESRNVKTRIESIKYLKEIEVENETRTFTLLENLFLSDSSEEIRNIAALMLREYFLEKAFVPMKWVFEHENSPKILKTTHETLIHFMKTLVQRNNDVSRAILIDEIKTMKDKEFEFGLALRAGVHQFTNAELADILINYFTHIFLKKTYWRIKYTVQNSKIEEISFPLSGLSCFPEVIKHLTSLKKLTMRYTQLKEIPDWIGDLNSLEFLNLNVNKIFLLPESIGSITILKELTLWRNEISLLPHSIGSLKNLKVLNLRLNNISDLPVSVGNLTSLKKLDLFGNKLKFLPESIGQLKNLEILSLNENDLKTLPKTIGALNSLELMDLEDNEITSIPDSIGDLKSLRYLNLSRNNIKELPDSISELKYLKELYIGGNRSLIIPKSVRDLENCDVKIYDFSY